MQSLTRERLIKSLAVIGILLLGMAVVFMTENILVSFVLGFVIYYLLTPVVNAIERSGINRRLGTTGLFILITAAFGFGFYLLLPATASQISAFKNELPELIDGTTKILSTSEQKLNSFLFNIYQIDISKSLKSTLLLFFRGLFDDLPNIISSSLSVTILAPFFAFFMLIDGQAINKKFLALVPNNFFELALNLQHRMNVQLGDFIRARLLEAGIVGIFVGVGLAIIGFPYAVLLAVFAGLANLVPYIGPVIGAVPAVLIAFVDGVTALEFLMVIAVYSTAQLIDNFFIIPLVVAKIADLHPVTVAIVIIIGAQIGGILGMIISIPLVCIIKLIITTTYSHLVEFNG
ncbi:MAG: AI-2E family transporter [Deltaproteobacteria bacterium]|nr:AI-2E family transporter [Deltaproteobacteria bacterium]